MFVNNCFLGTPLINIELPPSLRRIREGCFQRGGKLELTYIGNNIVSIEKYALLYLFCKESY